MSFQEKKTQGIVLRIFERIEDYIITIFTNEGLIINLRALGLQNNSSKNRMSLQLFSEVEVEFFQSTNLHSGRLKRAKLLNQTNIKNQKELNLLNLLKNLIIPNKVLSIEFYETLLKILDDLQFSIINIALIFYIMNLIIRNENIFFEYSKCCSCNSRQQIFTFSFFAGGLLCKNCSEHQNEWMSETLIKKLIFIFGAKSWNEVYSLNFSYDEEEKLKLLFSNYFNENLGFFTDLFSKI